MNEILQKRIEEAAKKICCTDCPMKIIRNCKGCVARENAIETGIFALQNQWISVEEALPDENKLGDSDFVFVKTSIRFPFPACYSYKHETWKDINHVAIHGVTHWMQIPEMKGGEE